MAFDGVYFTLLMRNLVFLSILGLSAACTSPREAPTRAEQQVVEWSAIAGELRPGPDSGFVVDVEIQAAIVDGWHIYSLTQATGGLTPMTVKVAPSPPYSLAGPVTGPQAVKARDPNFNIETETYSGEAIFRVPVKLMSASTISVPPLEIRVRSQACSDRLCLPARTTTLTLQPKQGKA
ncbi:MAG: protein-disulfide reductase DsbD family protein [Gemmatimonadaceae bacterium]|nr:protein-disulfide reductase DsbD family protein [Gemmatimonadaceae bacterium]